MSDAAEYQKKLYHWYKSKGICVKCHMKNALYGRITCEACMMKAREAGHRYYQRRKETAK